MSDKNSQLLVESSPPFFYEVGNMGMLKGDPGGTVDVEPGDDGNIHFEVMSDMPRGDTLHFTMTIEQMKEILETAIRETKIAEERLSK